LQLAILKRTKSLQNLVGISNVQNPDCLPRAKLTGMLQRPKLGESLYLSDEAISKLRMRVTQVKILSTKFSDCGKSNHLCINKLQNFKKFVKKIKKLSTRRYIFNDGHLITKKSAGRPFF